MTLTVKWMALREIRSFPRSFATLQFSCLFIHFLDFFGNFDGISNVGNNVIIMAALRSRCGHYIFILWFLLSFFFYFLA